MGENRDFLKDLRAEIAATQQRRAAYILAKLTFVVGLLGFGSASLGSIKTEALLYLAPMIAYLFDLYILGEDFGVKRAGMYLRYSPEAPSEETLWEQAVRRARDPFTTIAGPLSSLLVLVASVIALWPSQSARTFYWLWATANLIVTGGLWSYGRVLIRKLKKFEAFLMRERLLFRLPSGKEIKATGIGEMDFPNSDPVLVMNYFTNQSIDDKVALRKEIGEIWNLFQEHVENAKLKAGVICATPVERTGFVKSDHGYDFVFEQRDDGKWHCLDDDKQTK